jgi:hypothetical protein
MMYELHYTLPLILKLIIQSDNVALNNNILLNNKLKKHNIDKPIIVQGGSLRTWSYRSPLVERVQIVLSTEGCPHDADDGTLEWSRQYPHTFKMRVYVENGKHRPFTAIMETPSAPNTIAVRNIGQPES